MTQMRNIGHPVAFSVAGILKKESVAHLLLSSSRSPNTRYVTEGIIDLFGRLCGDTSVKCSKLKSAKLFHQT